MGDAVFNVARAALLVHALGRAPELLVPGTADRLHQDRREQAYPHSHALVAGLRAAGCAAAISGAGPSVIVLGPADAAERAADTAAALVSDGCGRSVASRWPPKAFGPWRPDDGDVVLTRFAGAVWCGCLTVLSWRRSNGQFPTHVPPRSAGLAYDGFGAVHPGAITLRDTDALATSAPSVGIP